MMPIISTGTGTAKPPPAAPPAAPTVPTWRQRLLGLFILWQIVFLLGANLLSFARYANNKIPKGDKFEAGEKNLYSVRAVVNEIAPDWADRKGHLWSLQKTAEGVADLWGQVTEQGQFWGMYMTAPRISDLPAVEIRWKAPKEGSPADKSETLTWYSDYEPDDLEHYVRFGELRFSRIEQVVVPRLDPLEDEEDSKRKEKWADDIAVFAYYSKDIIHNYLACRVKQMRSKNPDVPQPDEVILYVRQFRVNPPVSATEKASPIWSDPITIPIARWLPGKDESKQSLEAYNPVTERFEALRRPPRDGEED